MERLTLADVLCRAVDELETARAASDAEKLEAVSKRQGRAQLPHSDATSQLLSPQEPHPLKDDKQESSGQDSQHTTQETGPLPYPGGHIDTWTPQEVSDACEHYCHNAKQVDTAQASRVLRV